ncbi:MULTISPECIES: protein translocase subunit SecD [unclassified Methylophilus]|jgi:preprotein translocase subunit SecD|uniref:Protein translocase subunit SecD n=1 Tax=Methylophilus glucosoxydans TaxID=752553 RepID=A0ABW3GI50_9PROT|nr:MULTISPECIES: protein translocase subunit SecD [unclassified Methylophilus]MBF5039523.1 protein translocase subunit SecD [Methylophilus sp. 13]MDF0377720.1 protein translocase subunit SecD [Methylophilus sp. YYY-1]MDT7849108.1 protein translocase subunit SecD [Methylophilus sp. VKM B-3414]BEV08947.1 protein translocase subunit SecD [Methylophilus sp. DW102]
MNRYPLWKFVLIGTVIVIGLLYTIPNFFGESPAVQISPAKTSLKLDEGLLRKVEDTLKLADIPFDGVFMDASGVKVRFANTDTQLLAKDKLVANLGKDYTVALNLVPQTPNWLQSIGAKPMYLGLDLRGGVHFLLQVDMKAALDKAAESTMGDFRMALRKEKVNYFGIERQGQVVVVKFESEAEATKARNLLAKDYSDLTYKITGSDKDFNLTASMSVMAQKRIQEFALKQNLQTLHNRINELGVAEPIVQQQGMDRIVVQLPGVQDTAKAKEILGRTATLEIRMVDEEKSDMATLQKAQSGQVPFGDEMFTDREGRPVLVKKNVVLTGDRITDAGPGVNGQNGASVVNVTLDGRGAGIFKNVTRENVGKRMAILLIEKGSTEVITAPVINEEIGGGRVQISGMANAQEATDISLLLRAGALAAPMEIIEERTVGPSMGEENIKRGVHSTLWGFAAIAVMMIVYYMVFGGVSVMALGVNLLLLVAILSMLQATLTLPGLAAIALALGMAIDANVLINERIREELRNGNTPQASIHAGYDRAFDTILDSNVTTLIAGLALFMFGTGPIKGFAVVHVLGIMTSMFSAVLVSRALVNLLYGYRRKIEHLRIG